MREWRNRQTRTFEGRVGNRTGSSPVSRTKKVVSFRYDFFYPNRRFGISSRFSVHLISPFGAVSHHAPACISLRLDDIQHSVLMICNSLRNWWYPRLRRDFTSCIFVLWAHNGATILHPNTKVLDFQGLFVFLGVKINILQHCTFSPTFWTWTCDLWLINILKYLWFCDII